MVDLLKPDTLRVLAARPERLEELVEASPGRTPVVVDEVQKVPALLDVVHRLIESTRGYRFVLTGSSARKLKRAGVDLLVAFLLPVFSRRAKRQLVAHRKFHFFDAGVYRSIRPRGPLDRPEEIEGGALEGLVCQHLRAWVDYDAADARLHFRRTRAGSEVDFVLSGGDVFAAIEVKNVGTIRTGDLRSLKSFGQGYPQARPLLLYRGTERLKVEGVLCLPCEQFPRDLIPGRPLPP